MYFIDIVLDLLFCIVFYCFIVLMCFFVFLFFDSFICGGLQGCACEGSHRPS